MAFLPDDLLGEVDRRAAAAGVSRAEMLGHIFAGAVPRLFAELLNRLPERFGAFDAEALDSGAVGGGIARRQQVSNREDAPKLVDAADMVGVDQGSDGRR